MNAKRYANTVHPDDESLRTLIESGETRQQLERGLGAKIITLSRAKKSIRQARSKLIILQANDLLEDAEATCTAETTKEAIEAEIDRLLTKSGS